MCTRIQHVHVQGIGSKLTARIVNTLFTRTIFEDIAERREKIQFCVQACFGDNEF